jgi:succinate dehydrogenase/fumarate reductase cytochrome b subunit
MPSRSCGAVAPFDKVDVWRRARQRHWAGVQGVSAVIFSFYLLPHLLNAVLAIAGPSHYDEFLTASRFIFHQPAIEIAVLGSIVLHIIAGWYRNSLNSAAEADARRREPWTSVRSVHRLTGCVVALLVISHVFATRLRFSAPPLFFNGIAHAIRRIPLFAPYLVIFSGCAMIHMLVGYRKAVLQIRAAWPEMGCALARMTPTRIPALAIVASIAALTAGVLAFSGALYAVTVDLNDPAVRYFDDFNGALLAKLGF